MTDELGLTDPKDRGMYWEEIEDPEERGRAVQEVFDAIEEEQAEYRQACISHMRMYRNLNTMRYGTQNLLSPSRLSQPLSLNVVRNMINANHSRITKGRVKTTMQTIGGSWEMREKARLLDAFALGLTLKEKLPTKTPLAFLDASVLGHGVMKTFKDGRSVGLERTFAPNLVVDFAEGAFGPPAHYYEVKYIDQRRLARLFPKSKEIIDGLKPVTYSDDDFYIFQNSPSSTQIRVVEALYIDPDNPKKGFLSTVAQGFELAGAEWRQGDPYSVMRWSRGNMGFYGMGLAEELKGIQIEINRLLRKAQQAMSLLSNPYIMADRSSNIAKGQITDLPGTIIYFTGKEPRINSPQTVNPEVWAQIDRLYQRAYEISGGSQAMASGQKPGGLESGRALLVHGDKVNERYASVQRDWEEMHTEVIRKAILVAKQIPGYKVQVFGDEEFEEIDFKRDIGLDDDEWAIHAMPTALLGESPEAQLDTMERMIKMGIVSQPEELLRQMTAPDVMAYVNRITAPKRIIEKMVGKMLRGDGFTPPEPHLNLALALDTAQLMYLEARDRNCPEKNLELVRRFMVRTKEMIDDAAGKGRIPTIGAGAAGGGAPPALPEGPPPGGAPPPGVGMPVPQAA